MSRRQRSSCIVAVGMTLGLFSFLFFNSSRIAGQRTFPPPNRKPACTCFCGGGTPDYFDLFSREDIKAGKCWGGPLPADVCGGAVGELPAAERREICQRLRASR